MLPESLRCTMRRFLLFAACAAGLLLAMASPRVHAQTPDATLQEIRSQARLDVAGPDGKGTDGPLRRIGHSLATLHRAHTGPVPQAVRSVAERGLPVRGGRVAVTALAQPDQADRLRRDLEALGLEGSATAGRLVSGRLPISALRKAAQLSTLHSAWPSLAVTHVGITTSQGVAAMNTATLRERINTRGDGVTVGVLSNTYNNRPDEGITAEDDISTGDLPGPGHPRGFTDPVRVLDEGDTPSNDEGRALLQIVHDIAPAARLSYHNATDGIANFANGIRALADAGASIIADDVLFLGEPMFQDGVVAQAVDDVAFGQDVLYLSSAGNTGRNGYRSAFRASGQSGPAGGELHDFDPGPGVDDTQTFILPTPADNQAEPPSLILSLHWDQPAASAGGPGAESDLEIAIRDKAGGVLVLEQRANVGGNPFAFASFANDGSIDADNDGTPDSTFQVSIERLSGPRPGRMAYVAFTQNGNVDITEWRTNSPTLYGHAAARGAVAVGAAAYFNTPAFGVEPPRVNSFSALGGAPIVFDARGRRLATPQVRAKPEITAPDGGNTTFFGQIFDDGDPFPNFFGTSAAVAHAAGLAALVRSAFPERTAAAVQRALERSAIDIQQTNEGVDTGTGFDAYSGAGLVDGAALMVPSETVRGFAVARSGASSASITWAESTSSIARYTVEQSLFGEPFAPVATVDGGAGTYAVSVEDLEVGTHVFRLRWTRSDGATALGPARSVLIPVQSSVALGAPYPNPTRGGIRLRVTVQEDQGVVLAVYDVLGRLQRIAFSQFVRANRPRTVQIPASQLNRLASGLYFVRAIGTSFDEAVPFRIVR